MKNNRVLFIEYLDYFSLLLGLLAKLFVKKIFFYNAIPRFQSEKSHQRLKFLGIEWLSYTGLHSKTYCKCFDIVAELAPKVQTNQFAKSAMLSMLIECFQLDPVGIQKLEAVLKRMMVLGSLPLGASSIALIRHHFESSHTTIFYLPSGVKNFLIAQEVKDEDQLIPLSLHCLVLHTIDVIKFCSRIVYRVFQRGSVQIQQKTALKHSKRVVPT